MLKTISKVGLGATLLAVAAFAQVTDTKTANVSITVGAEATLTAASDVSLTTSGTTFQDYTGSSTFTYKVRTTQSGGTGTVTMKFTSDFAGASNASVVKSGDELKYTVSTAGVGTSTASSATIVSKTADTPALSFGADTHSSKAGDVATVSWTLPNDPIYTTGTITGAVVQYTISAQ
jgi:hypothetical protein